MRSGALVSCLEKPLDFLPEIVHVGIGHAMQDGWLTCEVTDDDGMTIHDLPDDIDTLKHLVIDTHHQVVQRDQRIAQHEQELAHQTKQIAQQTEKLTECDTEIKELESQIAYLKHKLFGRRGEKLDPEQLLLFNELQAKAETSPAAHPAPAATIESDRCS